jgi:CRP-like cAMP-binding protein
MTETSSRPANLLLRAVPAEEYQRLAPHLVSAFLPYRTIIYQPLDPVETVYFPESNLFSLVSTSEGGETTETALVGCTGMVGLPVVLGSGRTHNQILVQVEGSALTLPAHILKSEFARGGELQRMLLLYVETRLSQAYQQVLCNAQHTVLERTARWLLSVQDLLCSSELPLTQEFISQMLGVRRASVTTALGSLQQSKIIRSKRARITIIDQEALETTSCECYHLMKEESSRLLNFD